MQNSQSEEKRLHGGLSTGAKTVEGIERINRAVTKHGRYRRIELERKRRILEPMRYCKMMARASVHEAPTDLKVSGFAAAPKRRIFGVYKKRIMGSFPRMRRYEEAEMRR